MESLLGHSRQPRFGRRGALKLAALGGVSWLTPVAELLARNAETNRGSEPAQSLIFLWLAGGPSQLETFDPHPGKAIAGGTEAIRTSVTGIHLANGYERLADQLEHVALVRSVVSKEGDHERGTYTVKTGYRPNPTVVHPSVGAICCHQLPVAGAEIPRHVSILDTQWPSMGGFLGKQYDAFKCDDPAQKVPDITAHVADQRIDRRLADLNVIESAFSRGRMKTAAGTLHRETLASARAMMTSSQIAAFEVSREPEAVRKSYGDSPFGRGCLAARRLIEVGVRCEFGRTPQVNRLNGRDHWPHGFTMLLAGGGIRRGVVVGETDPEGGRKLKDPYEVADVHATVLTALGLDPTHEELAPIGRPIKLSEGKPIAALLA
jgi:hypothetical protein